MANNPYVNKVIFGSATLVDLTGTTATADKILQGYGAFGADGAWMDGTVIDGDNLEYGLINATSSMVGVGKIDSATVADATSSITEIGEADYMIIL